MLAGVSMIWGASYLLVKIALDGITPEMIVFARVALAAALLYIVIQIRGGERSRGAVGAARASRPLRDPGADQRRAAVLLIAIGETQISSGLTGILISPGPLFVALLAPCVDRSEQVAGKAAIGLVIGFAGVVVLIGLDAVTTAGRVRLRDRGAGRRRQLRRRRDVREAEVLRDAGAGGQLRRLPDARRPGP